MGIIHGEQKENIDTAPDLKAQLCSDSIGESALLLFPIIDPSGCLEGDAPETRAVRTIALSLSSQVVEANLALNHFLDVSVAERRERATGSSAEITDNWKRAMDERREIEHSLRADAGLRAFDREDWDKISVAVDFELLKRKIQRGEEPEWYKFHRPFLLAKSFVFCLDRIQRMIGVCRHYEISRAAAEAAGAHIEQGLPDLREFRNSLAHFEDRVRGRRQVRGVRQDIELQPIDTPSIKADGGTLVLECMEDDVFRSILADGTLGAIPIRADSMITIQEAVQMFLNALPWTSRHPRVVPSP